MVSSYDKYYEFSDHIVILGEYPDYFIADFLAEMVEVDAIYKHIQKFGGLKKVEKIGTKCIIIGRQNPSITLRGIIGYYANNFEYDNEVVYLKANVYGSSFNWYKKASLQSARYIIALSLKGGNNKAEIYESDQLTALTVKRVRETYPEIPVQLIL